MVKLTIYKLLNTIMTQITYLIKGLPLTNWIVYTGVLYFSVLVSQWGGNSNDRPSFLHLKYVWSDRGLYIVSSEIELFLELGGELGLKWSKKVSNRSVGHVDVINRLNFWSIDYVSTFSLVLKKHSSRSKFIVLRN